MFTSFWLLGLCALPALAYDPIEFPDGSDLHTFVSRPEIKAPRLNVTKHHPEAIKDGYLFFSPYSELQDVPKTVRRDHVSCQTGAHIYDGNGDLVWSGACKYRNRNVHGFRPHLIDGKHLLSFFVSPGNLDRGVTEKEAKQSHVLMSNSYEEISRPKVGGLYAGDNFHEFRMLPGGQSAIMTRDFMRKEDSVLHDLAQVPVWDTGFREVDLATGKQIFDWSPISSGVNIDESFDMTGLNHTTKDAPWDYFHINSVDKSERGDYMVSARHTFTVYKISGETGNITWRLGGPKNDFKMLDNLDFHWQHHARFRFENDTHSIISLFDNHGDDAGRNPTIKNQVSNAIFILLSTATTPMTAQVIRGFARPDGGKSSKLGSVQVIGEDWEKSSVFVDWAVPVYVSEHDVQNRLVMEARFASPRFNSYRAFKYPFVGKPTEKPAYKALPIAIGDNGTAMAMYMSWNGATEVRSWSMYGADTLDGEYKLLKTVPKKGFETSYVMTSTVKYSYAEALDSMGKPLSRSGVFNATWTEKSLAGIDLGADELFKSPSGVEAECKTQAPATQTVYVTASGQPLPAETVYIHADSPPQPTWTPKSAAATTDYVDEEEEAPKMSQSAQNLKALQTREAFGVFCMSGFALYGLYIAIRRVLYLILRWRHGYRPITQLQREPSFTDAEKAG